MTENEAMEILKISPEMKKQIPNLTEVYEVAVKALEKQIPKTVYHFTDDDTFETSCCGIDVSNEDFKYCPECGQLLGEVEEVEEHDGE